MWSKQHSMVYVNICLVYAKCMFLSKQTNVQGLVDDVLKQCLQTIKYGMVIDSAKLQE